MYMLYWPSAPFKKQTQEQRIYESSRNLIKNPFCQKSAWPGTLIIFPRWHFNLLRKGLEYSFIQHYCNMWGLWSSPRVHLIVLACLCSLANVHCGHILGCFLEMHSKGLDGEITVLVSTSTKQKCNLCSKHPKISRALLT